MNFLALLCLILAISLNNCSSFGSRQNEKLQRGYKLDRSHFFTKYLDNHDIEGARSNDLVNLTSELFVAGRAFNPDFITSYLGYYTVNKECNSNLYSWFFKNKVIVV